MTQSCASAPGEHDTYKWKRGAAGRTFEVKTRPLSDYRSILLDLVSKVRVPNHYNNTIWCVKFDMYFFNV